MRRVWGRCWPNTRTVSARQLSPVVGALRGGFRDALRDAERQVDSRIANGLSKNTEALNDLGPKMQEAAERRRWEIRQPILSTLAFLRNHRRHRHCAVMLVALIAVTLLIGWALGIGALAAGLLLVAGMAAVQHRLRVRRAAGSGARIWPALGGAFVDFGKAVPGMLYDMTGIPKLRRAFSNEYMSPYERGELVGEGGTEFVMAIFVVRGAAKGAAGLYRKLPRFRFRFRASAALPEAPRGALPVGEAVAGRPPGAAARLNRCPDDHPVPLPLNQCPDDQPLPLHKVGGGLNQCPDDQPLPLPLNQCPDDQPLPLHLNQCPDDQPLPLPLNQCEKGKCRTTSHCRCP